MKPVLSCTLGILCALFFLSGLQGQGQQNAAATPRQTSGPAQSLKKLGGHRADKFARIAPTGELPPSTKLALAIGIPLHNNNGLQKLLADVHNRSSPRYGQYLTTEQFAEQFSPTEKEYQRAIHYASAHGLTVTSTYKNRLVFDVVGSVADIEKVLHLRLRLYPHPTGNRHFYAPDREPSIDPQFEILNVNGLDNFELPHSLDLKTQSLETNAFESFTKIGSGPLGFLVGNDYRNVYAPGVTLTGRGQSIAIVAMQAYFPGELTRYQQLAGLPSVNITNIAVNGFNAAPNGDDIETALDIELAMSMAPGATIMAYQGFNMLDIFNQIASDNIAKQVTSSFGQGFGTYPNPTMINILNQMNAQGQWLFIASGDLGATRLSLIEPGGYPNETICGGTDLFLASQGGGRGTEITWNPSGGGWYTNFAIPGYQQGLSMTANHGSTTYRNSPDVGMVADYFLLVGGGETNIMAAAGTSGSSPLWAGFLALVNEQRAHNGLSSIGNLNDLIYTIGKGPNYSSAFLDITTGNNTNSVSPTNFFAVTGYDLCTGWGVPNGTNLINLLAASTQTMQVTPGFGFSTSVNYNSTVGATNTTFSIHNNGGSSLSWSPTTSTPWLSISSYTSTVAGGGTTQVTVSLVPGAVNNLSPGMYYGTVTFSDTLSETQTRVFVLTVSAAAQPLTISGYNASIIVPNNGTIAQPKATNFGVGSDVAFYQAGLSGGALGLPANGRFQSAWDGQTAFQFGPYGSNNVLMLGANYSNSGTLTLSSPQSLNSLVILAASAYSTDSGTGTCTVNFSGGGSQNFAYNAQDWFFTRTNSALMGFGRIKLSTFTKEDNGFQDPNVYQTTIPLGKLGLTQPVTSITFNRASNSTNTAIFAISGVGGPLSGLAPTITQQPQSMTNASIYASSAFSVGVAGAPPFSYQWYSNSVALPLGVLPTLIFNPGMPTNFSASYYVVASNQYGSVQSSAATLTVYRTPPQFIQQPATTNLNLFVGDTLSISSIATNALPISYSWKFNGATIAGATNTTLTLTNLQTVDSGIYTLVATTTIGVATNNPVLVNVISRPSAVFPLMVLQMNPVSYWRLNETSGGTAYDYVGGNNGSYTNVALGQPGYGSTPGTGTEPSQLAALFGPTNNARSYVSLPNLSLSVSNGSSATFTIAAWVKANSNVQSAAGIVAKGYGGGDEEFGLACGANGNAFQFFIRNAQSAAPSIANSVVYPDDNWHHLVAVCDQPNSKIYLYVDGTNAAQASVTPGTGIHRSTFQGSIGARASNTGTPEDLQFLGSINDVALFTNALSPSQVATLYGSAVYGPWIQQQPVSLKTQIGGNLTNSVVASGTNLFYQWYGPTGAVAGATNSSMVLTNLQLTQRGNYFVAVSNIYGTTQSSNVWVAVLPPVTTPYPQAVMALNPLAYWRLNETNGTIAYDYANFNEGTYNNVLLGQPPYTSQFTFNTDSGDFGAQFVTNGQRSYISIPTIDLVQPFVAVFSVAAWVKADPSLTSGAKIIGKGGGDGSEQFSLDCGGSGHAFQFYVRGHNNGYAYTAASSVVPDNKWHLLVGVCDENNSIVTLYVDGTNAASVFTPFGAGSYETSVPASMGARQNAFGSPDLQFVGELDDVAIFQSALGSAQVLSLYKTAAGLPQILQQPAQGWSAIQGAATTNQISASGVGISIQWYGPTGLIAGATSQTLIINNVSLADAGTYYARVSSPLGPVQSSNTVLKVYASGRYASAFQSWPDGTIDFQDGSQLFSTGLGGYARTLAGNGIPAELQLSPGYNKDGPTYGVVTAFLLPDLDPQNRIFAFSAKWNSQVYGINGNYGGSRPLGYGFSFNFGPMASVDLLSGQVENGYGAGLTFSENTYANRSSVIVNGITVATNAAFQFGSYNPTRYFWEVDWNYTNGLSVWINGTVIFTNVPTPGYIPHVGDRFAWATRQDDGVIGAPTAEVRLANIVVTTGGTLARVQGTNPFFADVLTLSPNAATNAFATNSGVPWKTATNSGYVGESLTAAKPLVAYALTSSTNTAWNPKQWNVEGSNNGGANWLNVAAMTDYFSFGLETRAWLTTNWSSAFSAYRLNVTTNVGDPSTALQQVRFYQLNSVPGPTGITQPASQIALSSVQLNGSVTPGVSSVAWFQWGTSTSYGNTTAPQSVGSGNSSVPLNAALSGLTPATAYHYQVVLSNQYGLFFGGDAQFSTIINPVVFSTSGASWSSTQIGSYTTPAMTNGVVRLTDGAGNETRSVFFQAPQYVGAFKASFTYQDVGGGGADGAAFVLQNDPRGTSALGGVGGSLGYGTANPITPSAALELNIYSGGGQIIGYTFLTNGLTAANGANGNYSAPGSINLASGHPINVTMNYAGGSLALGFTDTVSSATFSTNLNVGNLTNLLGNTTAYIGFTGADGGIASTQIITNFSFVSIPPQMVSMTGSFVTISWPAPIAGFKLQRSSDLVSTNWQDLTNQPTILSGQNQIVVPVTGSNQFYRLKLP